MAILSGRSRDHRRPAGRSAREPLRRRRSRARRAPSRELRRRSRGAGLDAGARRRASTSTLREYREQTERKYIVDTLKLTGWNILAHRGRPRRRAHEPPQEDPRLPDQARRGLKGRRARPGRSARAGRSVPPAPRAVSSSVGHELRVWRVRDERRRSARCVRAARLSRVSALRFDESDLHLAAVVTINRARRVDDRDPALGSKPGAWTHLPFPCRAESPSRAQWGRSRVRANGRVIGSVRAA